MMDEAQGERPESADSHHKLDRKEAIFLAVIIAIGLLLTFVKAYNLNLNSDHSQFSMIFYDLAERGVTALSGWYTATNNYLLTDTPFYMVTGMLFGMGPATVRLTALAIFLLGVLAAAAIIYRAFSLKAALYFSTAMLFLPDIAISELLKPNNHNSNILITLIAYLITMRLMDSKRISMNDRIKNLPVLALVVAVGVFSDPTMLITYSVPAIVTMAILGVLRKGLPISRPKAFMFASILIVASAGAIMLQYAVSIYSDLQLSRFFLQTKSIQIGGVTESIAFTAKLFSMLSGLADTDGGPWPATLARAPLLVAALACVIWTLRNDKSLQRQSLIVFLLSMSALLTATYVMKATAASMTVRYVTPVVYSYTVFIAVALAGHWRSRINLRPVLLASFVTCALLAGADIAKTEPRPQQHLDLARFLEKKGLHLGYSQFWSANIITMLSENRVKVRAIEFTVHGARPFLWLSNINWYSPDSDSGPSFLLIPKGTEGDGFSIASPMMIEVMFGPPTSLMEYKDTRIYVWDRNILGIRR